MTFAVLLIVINLVLLGVGARILKRKNVNLFQRDIFKNVAVLELAFGALSVMLALMITLYIIESAKEGSSFLSTAGSARVALLAILYGFGILHFFTSSAIVVKLLRSNSR